MKKLLTILNWIETGILTIMSSLTISFPIALILTLSNCTPVSPDEPHTKKQSYDLEYMFSGGDVFEVKLDNYESIKFFEVTILLYDRNMHTTHSEKTEIYYQDREYLYFYQKELLAEYTDYLKPMIIYVTQTY